MKLTAIILTSIIFSQSLMIHLSDIMAFGELVEHYQFHQKEHGDDFFNFLSKHYGSDKKSHDDSHQDEKRDHKKLPFQHSSHHSSTTVFLYEAEFFTNSPISSPIDESGIVMNESLKYQLFTSGIFQPPKQA